LRQKVGSEWCSRWQSRMGWVKDEILISFAYNMESSVRRAKVSTKIYNRLRVVVPRSSHVYGGKRVQKWVNAWFSVFVDRLSITVALILLMMELLAVFSS
jgi:hypothetical protein